MKLRQLCKYLESQADVVFKEKTKHLSVLNQNNGIHTTIPRHRGRDLPKPTVLAICKQLGVPSPPSVLIISLFTKHFVSNKAKNSQYCHFVGKKQLVLLKM